MVKYNDKLFHLWDEKCLEFDRPPTGMVACLLAEEVPGVVVL